MKRLFAYNPTLSQAWGLVALTILIQLVSGLVVVPFIPADGATQSWHLLLSYVLCFVIMIFIVMKMGETEYLSPVPAQGGGAKLPPLGGGSGWGLLLFFIPALAIVIEPLYMWIPMPEQIKQLFETAFKNDMPTFLSVVVAAPFAEEWLCRGVILKGLLRHYSPRKAIIWSAILFGVLHINPWQAIPAFCIALAIGWVYWRTRSLWPCIFMHAVNNSIAFLMLHLFPDAASDATTLDVAGAYYGLVYAAALLCCAFTGYGLWWMSRKNYLAPNR
ncbi:MAG: CPBP family intramembrane metalloprotease [Prevotellaceae bacterium]|nr:CPBP family intramembrane metalloprotease [Prevotellaceae bacterium]